MSPFSSHDPIQGYCEHKVNAIRQMCNVCLTTFDIRDGPNDVDHDSPIVLPSIVVPQSLHSLQRLKTLYPKSFHKSTAPSSVAFKPPFTCPWLWYTPTAGLCPPSLRLTNVRHPRPDYPRKQTLWTPLHSRHLTSPPFPFPWRSNKVRADSWTHKRKRPCKDISEATVSQRRMHGNASFSCY